MFWDVFAGLCADKGLAPNAVAKLLSLSSGSVTAWKNGTIPSNATLKKIADYFSVSVDYLLGKTDKKEKDPAILGEAEEEYILANRSKDGKQAIQKLTKNEYDALVAWVETLRRNTN